MSRISLLLLVMLLPGCALFTEVVREPYPIYLNLSCRETSKISGIITSPVEPKAVMDAEGVWWVALTPEHYENLAINVQESIRYIKDQKSLIIYYRSCIDDFNKKIDKLRTNGVH